MSITTTEFHESDGVTATLGASVEAIVVLVRTYGQPPMSWDAHAWSKTAPPFGEVVPVRIARGGVEWWTGSARVDGITIRGATGEPTHYMVELEGIGRLRQAPTLTLVDDTH